MLEFNFIDEPDQEFTTTLNGTQVTMRFRYNTLIDRWSMDVLVDAETRIHGRRLVSGINLIKDFGLGVGILFCYVDKNQPINRDNLPDGIVRFFHTTEAEIDAFLAA